MIKVPLPRLPFALLGAALVSVSTVAHAEPGQLQSGDLVAVCGDSITEQRLYSSDIADYLVMCQPVPKVSAVQFGWGGETSWGFLARIKNDVLPFKPTVATICYGMNDGGYRAVDPAIQQRYRDTMTKIVQTLKEGGVRFIVVGTPGVVDSTAYNKPNGVTPDVYNETLRQLGEIDKEIATEQGVGFADVHGPMLDVMAKLKAKYGPTYDLAGRDGVHPRSNGHLVMAYAFLKGLNCSGEIGTITVDMRSNKATATEGHQILSASAGDVEVESSRYPFCFYGKPEDPESTAGVIEFLPFNQDLNRFMLVVKNASAPKLKVTWGTTSKEFTSQELAKGINLAAEFIDNPFSQPFLDVQKAIRDQQALETMTIKMMMHNVPEIKIRLGESNSFWDEFADNIVKSWKTLNEKNGQLVKPVKHTIKIEAAS